MLPFLLDQPTHLVNWASPLNQGLKLWLVALPGRTGGGTWFDISGNGNHGTLTNMDPATDWVGSTHTGGYGSVDFAPSNDYIELSPGNRIYPSSSTETTVAVWWMRRGTGVGSVFGAANDSLSGRFGIRLNVAIPGKVEAFGRDGADTRKAATATYTAAIGEWRMTVATISGTTLTLYGNGAVEATTTVDITATLQQVGSASQTLILGNGGSGLTAPHDGQLNNMRIWNRALGAAEVLRLYQDDLAGNPQTLNRIRRPLVFDTGGGGGGGGNRRRRLLLCGARAA